MIDKPHSPSCERNRGPILAVLREYFAQCRHVLEIGSGTGQHAVHFAKAMPWLRWQCSDRAEYLPGIRLWLDEAGLVNTPAPVALDVARRPWPLLPLSRAGSDDLLANHRFADRPTNEHRSGRGLLGKAKPHLAAHWDEDTRNSVRGESPENRSSRRPNLPSGHLLPPAKEANNGFDAAFSANTLHILGWQEVEAFFAGLEWVLADDATLVVYGPFNYSGAFSSASNRDFDTALRARDPRMGIRDFELVDALARAIGLQPVDDIAMPANNRCLVWQRRM